MTATIQTAILPSSFRWGCEETLPGTGLWVEGFEVFMKFLFLANQILASFTLILAFSLLVFIVAYNRRSAIGRAFAILLGCMCFTYAGDVALFQVDSLAAAVPWLKFQWVGIAFIPAAYLHFSDALLRTTNAFSRLRRAAVVGGYVLGGVFLYMAVFTNLLVRDGFFLPGVTQFQAGPLFWLFTIYFYAVVIWGVFNTQRARDRCLTSATRRRMTYLMLSFAAPSFGVFPYMLVAHQASAIPPFILLTALLFVNVGIVLMIAFMAYNVSFFDAFTPDRVVKYVLVTYLLRGPLVAGLVVMVLLALPDQPVIWGVPRRAILNTLVVAIIVLAQIAATYLKPVVSRLVYHREREEVELLRYIDTRLLTTTDLQQALENVLTTICDLLRVRTGFIANTAARSGPRLEASVGEAEAIEAALTNFDAVIFKARRNGERESPFVSHGGFWYAPLRTEAGDVYLGLLGIEARSETPNLAPHEAETVRLLIQQAEFVLEDRLLQHNVFNALRGIAPEMERAQRLRSAVRYLDSPVDNLLTPVSPIHRPDFPKMVHEALTHYWGGPKLTNSPLLQLNVVQKAAETHDGDPVRALRAVLARAIEYTRPEGERRTTASEWLLYNILELKFIQGLKVRDIAARLARSEADLYRKQKIAIEAVARALSEMETRNHAETETVSPPPSSQPPGD
ncbi:MAG: hypothetical protein D6796_07045 [Caldilineae bacterium]|nr:MAG: hypothetical protein D6796_07045 [Caldilineae bacterium]